jgi:anti-anti-sigma factor
MELQPDDTVVDTVCPAAVLALQGELDMAGVPEFEAAVAAALATDPGAVEVDVSELTFLDSRGVGALVTAWRRATDAGVRFALRGEPAGNVRRVLELTGVADLLG